MHYLLFFVRQRVKLQEVPLYLSIAAALLIYIIHILIASPLVGCVESALVGLVDNISKLYP